ncbi:MAG TPA: hypothetical protein VF062_06480 [Candidatus Limnocylindrales bacterium]
MKRFSKLIGSVLGGVTSAGVAAVLSAFGVEVTPAVAAAIAVLLAALGTYLAPANREA